MARDNDFRTDPDTAEHIAEALKMQSAFGFDIARRHLLSLGIESQFALRMLAIRYERRASASAACPKEAA